MPKSKPIYKNVYDNDKYIWKWDPVIEEWVLPRFKKPKTAIKKRKKS